MRVIDLRSDTVTRPDAEMRRAMAEAEVGDDVYREDPTVNRLEELAAERIGTEAALFVPSGTMGNQVALNVQTRPGSEIIGESLCHIFHYEMGAMAALSGLMPRPVEGKGGLLEPQDVAAAVYPEVDYHSRTGLIAVENTHNLAGGVVSDRPRLEALIAVARENSLPIHLDGARIFNAAAALGTTASELAAGFDSVMFCLSKGLGAPVGSLLCGSEAFIHEARRVRKMLGGGLRQVGVLAAAGLVALEKGPERLGEDHENAHFLASEMGTLGGVRPDPGEVPTNIVMLSIGKEAFPGLEENQAPSATFVARLKEAHVLAVPFGPEKVRLVTHRDVSRADIEEAVSRARTVIPG